ncbi:hypothetical protein [Georgenia yuyongxinii]
MTVTDRDSALRVGELVDLAVRALPAMWRPEKDEFAQTLRGVPSAHGPLLRPEGTNLRYSAIVALGAGRLPEDAQRTALAGQSAAELATGVARRAVGHADPGTVALAAWAVAEVTGEADAALVMRLRELLAHDSPLPTVDMSWMLSAALAGPPAGGEEIIGSVRRRLLAEQGAEGIFPHVLPATAQGRLRAHVGCFADQVYPIQALARLARAHGDDEALAVANATAARICALQGDAGQWWWHYDVRDGSVVEGFPVYSVHQHAMGPMALRELRAAGGTDHTAEMELGLSWLDTHPEVVEDLVSDRFAVIWRKVGRREPAKAARKIAAALTSLRPGLHLPGLDKAFPAGVVDHECRPYELGWLLYAWLDGTDATDTTGDHDD